MTENILGNFPKKRFALPAEQLAIYEQEYLANRSGSTLMSSLSQKLEGWMHRKVAAGVTGRRLLEIGAGTLNQEPYMRNKSFDCYDVVEPAAFLYENSPHKQNISHFYDDIGKCVGSYDSIFSIAALEHITSLPQMLAMSAMLLKDGGRMINAIPCEGGFLWGVSWRLSTGLAYKLRTGFSYKNIMRHEHVNNHDEIVELHHYFFEKIAISYFPFPSKHLAFYCCIVAETPKLEICKKFLS